MDNAAVVAVIAGVPSFLLGFLAYRRSVKVDAVAAQSGVATLSQSGTAQIIEGLNRLVDQLQEDNAAFRADVLIVKARADLRDEAHRVEVERLEARIERRDVEIAEYRRTLKELRQRHGDT